MDTDELNRNDIKMILNSPAKLIIEDDQASGRPAEKDAGTEGADAWRCEIVGSIYKLTVGEKLGDYTFIDIFLGPRLASLSQLRQNRLYMDRNAIHIVGESLRFGGLENEPLEIRVNGDDYPNREFVLQYNEDLLSFILRTLERDGLGLHFEYASNREIPVLTDSSEQYRPLLDKGEELAAAYAPISMLGSALPSPTVFGTRVESNLTPLSLMLKDYNWRDPSSPLQVNVPISPIGRGALHLYGENFETEREGLRLSNIIKEEIISSSRIITCQSTIPGCLPGRTIVVDDFGKKPSPDNRYLITGSEFQGGQAEYLSKALGLVINDTGGVTGFFNRLDLKLAIIPYRPPRKTPRPKVSGSLTAWIDGQGDGGLPEMDAYGRYKVMLPLDVSGRSEGNASAWVRMAQPSVGSGYGQNMPLSPGTEVLLTFIDGNPDRPVISGAVANSETRGIANSLVPSMGGIASKGGGSLIFNDTEGAQALGLSSPCNRAGLAMLSNNATCTVLHSDLLSTMAAGTHSVNASYSRSAAGREYTIKASNSLVRDILGLVESVKSDLDAKTADDLNNRSAGRQSASLSPPLTRHMAVANALGMMSIEGMELSDKLSGLRRDAILRPHQNLVRISANAVESLGSFKAKAASSASLIALMSSLVDKMAPPLPEGGLSPGKAESREAFDPAAPPRPAPPTEKAAHDKYDELLKAKSALAKPEKELSQMLQKLRDTSQELAQLQGTDAKFKWGGYFNKSKDKAASAQAKIKDLSEAADIEEKAYLKKLDEVQKMRLKAADLEIAYKFMRAQAEDDEPKAIKPPAAPFGPGADPALALADLLSSEAVWPAPEPKGLVVRNDDSYVSVKARHGAAFSGYGPVLIESSEASIADMLELETFDGQIPSSLFKPEAAPFEEGSTIETYKTVLLRSRLVRAMAEEVSLKAKEAVLAESEKSVQLIAGLEAGQAAGRAASDLAEEKLKPLLKRYLEANPSQFDEKSIAHLNLLKAGQAFLEIDRGLKRDAEADKGVLIKTNEPGMDIIAQTTHPDSEIKLIQGAASRDDLSKAAQISLAPDKAQMRLSPDSKLSIDKRKGEAVLSAAANALLSLKLDEVMLKAGPGSKFELKDGQASLQAPAGISMVQSDSASLKITPSGVSVKGDFIFAEAKLIRL
jgi:type VI secretion system VgrG family protein